LHFTIPCPDGLLRRAVPRVFARLLTPLVSLVAEMLVHFRLEHLLDETFCDLLYQTTFAKQVGARLQVQIFEYALERFRVRFHRVFLQEAIFAPRASYTEFLTGPSSAARRRPLRLFEPTRHAGARALLGPRRLLHLDEAARGGNVAAWSGD